MSVSNTAGIASVTQESSPLAYLASLSSSPSIPYKPTSKLIDHLSPYLRKAETLSGGMPVGFICTWTGKGSIALLEDPARVYHKVVVMSRPNYVHPSDEEAVVCVELQELLKRKVLHSTFGWWAASHTHRIDNDVAAAEIIMAIEAKGLLSQERYSNFAHVAFRHRFTIDGAAKTGWTHKLSWVPRNTVALKVNKEVGNENDWGMLLKAYKLNRKTKKMKAEGRFERVKV